MPRAVRPRHRRSSAIALGAIAGVALGVASGWYAWLARLVRPIVDLFRPIPPLAWIPIAIVWFGLGEPSKIFVIFLGAFFPIFTNAWRGMVSVPPVSQMQVQSLLPVWLGAGSV